MDKQAALDFITVADNAFDDEAGMWVSAWHNRDVAFLLFTDVEGNNKKFLVSVKELP
jgi:hypothetical protein